MDNGSNGTAAVTAPSSAAPAQPAPVQAPEGQRFISNEEYAKLQRYEQQAKGSQGFYESARKFGFEKPEDFDSRFGPLVKRGIDPRRLSTMFEDPPAEKQDHNAPDFDPEEFKRSFRDELKRENAIETHQAAMKAEGELFEKVAKKLAGANADEIDVEQARHMVAGWVNQNREFYPENHPLHKDYYAPLSDALATKAEKYFADLRTKKQAQSMKDKGDAALNGANRSPSTPAGNKSGQGKPENNETRRPDGKPNREKVEAYYAEKIARRGH